MVADGGVENFATILHKVNLETDDDVDRVEFIFGADKLYVPEGPVSYWQVPQFSVTQVDSAPGVKGAGAFVVAFRGAEGHDTILGTSDAPQDKHVKSYDEPNDMAAPPEFPVLQSAHLLKDSDKSLAWGLGTKTIKCPQVYALGNPPRAVIEFPH